MKHPESNDLENQSSLENRGNPADPLITVTPGAVALSYHSGMIVPRIVAKGRGLIAEEIIRRVQEAGLYVHESAELVSLLMQVIWTITFHQNYTSP